jgi:hypothetical protein
MQRAKASAVKIEHWMADFCQHSPHNPIFPGMQHQLDNAFPIPRRTDQFCAVCPG